MGLLVYVLILVIVFGLIAYVISLIPLPHPFRPVALAVLAILLILVLLNLTGLLGPPWVRLH